MISAYLRTLAVAEDFWGMPPERAQEMALLALPVHPTLGLLRPKRPSWLPGRTEFDGDDKVMEGAVRSLVERVQRERPGDELVAFSSPVVISVDRCVEVSVVRWAQAAGSSVPDEGLAEHLKDGWRSGPLLQSDSPEPLGMVTILVLPDLRAIEDEVQGPASGQAARLRPFRLSAIRPLSGATLLAHNAYARSIGGHAS